MVTLIDAKEATKSIVKKLQPLSVILFGSVAREGSGTDLDLLVITHDKSISTDPNMLLYKCLKRFHKKFGIDSFIVPQSILIKYYREGSPFLRLISKEGRVLYMKNAVQEWLKQAEDELNMAVYLLQGRFFKGVCFHAQQAIEKAIKAGLLSKGWELEKIHNIERLIAISEDYKIRLKLSDEEIVFMDSIYRGRYPAEVGILPLGDPSIEDAEKAVGIAKRINKEIRTRHRK